MVQSATQLQGGILPTGEGSTEGGIGGATCEGPLAVARASQGQLVGVEGQSIIAVQLPIDIEGGSLERRGPFAEYVPCPVREVASMVRRCYWR